MLKKALSFIPGFRSGRKWKKIIATIFYLLCIFVGLLVFMDSEHTLDSELRKWESFNLIFFFFILPFVLITNVASVRKKLPLFKSNNYLIKGIGWVLTVCILFIGFGIVSSKLAPLHSPEYIAQQKVDRDNRMKQEAEEKAKKKAEKAVALKAEEEKKKDENAKQKTADELKAKQEADLKQQEEAKKQKEAEEKKASEEQKKKEQEAKLATTKEVSDKNEVSIAQNTDQQKDKEGSNRSTWSSVVSSLGGMVKSAVGSITSDDPFKSGREAFSEENVLKLTERDMIYLEVEKKYFGFGAEYFKRTLNLKDYIYFGELKDNKPNGKGVLFTVSYSDLGKKEFVPLYIGTFKDGVFNGYGKKYMNASRYYSEVFDAAGLLPGFASIHDYSNLDKLGVVFQLYEGFFKDGKYDGKGNYMMVDESGSVEEPLHLKEYVESNAAKINEFLKEWSDSKSPVLISPLPPLKTYTRDTGEFKNGSLNGKAKKYNDKNQLIYEGKFKGDVYSGSGKLYFDDGKIKYEGEFKNGKYDGKGTLYNGDGSVKYKGEWNSGDIK